MSSQSVTGVGDGEVDVQLTALSPQSTITVGLGIGQPVSGECALVVPGSYCVAVVDVGNIQGFDTAMVNVAHP